MKTLSATYGVLELRDLYRKYILSGLLLAGLFHMTLIAAYKIYANITKEQIEFPTNFGKGKITVIPIPLPIGDAYTVPNISVASIGLAQKGIPIPIPDASISLDATIADQTQMNSADIGKDIGDPNGTSFVIPDGTTLVDEETAPPIFQPIEKAPIPINRVNPLYPELARRAAVEGIVYINLWITKEGKVKKAEISKSTSDIFNQAALDAAVQWTFTPAIMNNGPVSVWVTVPFKFRLNPKQ